MINHKPMVTKNDRLVRRLLDCPPELADAARELAALDQGEQWKARSIIERIALDFHEKHPISTLDKVNHTINAIRVAACIHTSKFYE